MGLRALSPFSFLLLPSVLYLVAAILLLVFLVGYVAPNIIRYPFHTLVFVVIAIALAVTAGAGEGLMDRLKASRHPAARRCHTAYRTLVAILDGVPPYSAGRWWVVRTLLQSAFYAAVFGATLAAIVGIGFLFTRMDKIILFVNFSLTLSIGYTSFTKILSSSPFTSPFPITIAMASG